MTPMTQKPSAKLQQQRMKQRKQEHRGQCHHQKQCESVLPLPQEWTLHAQFVCVIPECQLNRPSASRSKDEAPSLLQGKEVMGSLVTKYHGSRPPPGRATSSHNGAAKLGWRIWTSTPAIGSQMTGPSIPDLTLLLGAFASNELPDFAFFSCWIQNNVPFFPTGCATSLL